VIDALTEQSLFEQLFKYLVNFALYQQDEESRLNAIIMMRHVDKVRTLQVMRDLAKVRKLPLDLLKKSGFAVCLDLIQAGLLPVEALANETLMVKDGKFYILYDDLTDDDLIALFDGKHEQEFVRKVFGGDDFELFYSDYRSSLEDVLNYSDFTPANELAIKAMLLGKVVVDDETGKETVLNSRNISRYRLSDLILELHKQGEIDELEEAITRAYDDADRDARSGAYNKGYLEAVADIIGGGSPVWSGDKVGFPVNLARIVELAGAYADSQDCEFAGDDYRDLVRVGTEERAKGPEDPSYHADEVYFNERLSELLRELS
jgi:hypothetical protein